MFFRTQRNTTHELFFILILLLAGVASDLLGQCPPSTVEGVHVYVAGERLDSLAAKYGIEEQNILRWNGLQAGQEIEECMKLIVSAIWVTTEDEGERKASISLADTVASVRQAGKWHEVKPGESVKSIARLYGIDYDDFLAWNQIDPNRMVAPGSVLRKTDPRKDLRVGVRPATRTVVNTAPKPAPLTEESAAEDGVTPERPDENPEPTPDLQRKGEEKTRVSLGGPATPNAKAIELDFTNYRQSMSAPEYDLLKEVNLLRGNPQRYVKYIKDYVKSRRKDKMNKYKVDPKAVKSVVERLKETEQLSQLVSHPCLYLSAQKHGEYLQKNNLFSHQGRNGEEPYERTMAECPDIELSKEKDRRGFMVGNENLGVGSNAREAVIRLLIDEGSDVAGHQNTLLAADWEYMVAHYFGSVRGFDYCFIQVFGK